MRKNNNILILMSNPNGWRNPSIIGGGEIQTINLIEKLTSFDWIVLSTTQLKPFLKKGPTYLLARPIFKKTSLITDVFQGIALLIKLVKLGLKNKNKYDLVYSSTTNFSDIFPAWIISLLTNKKLIVKYHISLYSSKSLITLFRNYRYEKVGILDSLIKSILSRISLYILSNSYVISVSNTLNNQLLNCGLNRNRLFVNHNGIDFNYLKKLKLDENKKIYDLCFMGRVEKSKGVYEFIELVKRISRLIKCKAVIIGSGSEIENVKKIVLEESLSESIEIVGFLGEERYKLLQRSKILVSLSKANEGFGLSNIEAIYYNIPIIAYDHPVLREIFEKFHNVYFFKEELTLIEKKIYELLTKNPKEKIVTEHLLIENYSLERCAYREEIVLKKIIKENEI